VTSRGDTNRWQLEEPALFEFVNQASGGKGFELPSMGLPAPVPANVLGELMPAPLRVLGNQITQPGKIRGEDVPTLTSNRFIHGMIMPWVEPLVQYNQAMEK